MLTAEAYNTGYLGARTDRVAVYIYPFPTAENLNRTAGLVLSSETAATTRHPGTAVTGFSMSRTISDHGSFAIKLSFSNAAERVHFRKTVHEDDYVLVTDSNGFHLIFGFIDSMVEDDDSSDGATQASLTVHGFGWGERIRRTEIWFDILSEGVLGAMAVAQIFAASKSFAGPPHRTIMSALLGFLRKSGQLGRAQWQLPPSLQAQFNGTTTLADSIVLDVQGFVNAPYRVNALQPAFFQPDAPNVWEYALGWADLAFCELFTDVAVSTTQFPAVTSAQPIPFTEGISRFPTLGAGFEDFRPLVTFRDRPFPSATIRSKSAARGRAVLPFDHPLQPWRELQTYRIPRQAVLNRTVSVAANERRNAFFLQIDLPPGMAGTYAALVSPLKNAGDAARYGVRRMDVKTAYIPLTTGSGLNQAGIDVLKARARDFYCANHLFRTGHITLNQGLPTVRVGTKLHLLALQKASYTSQNKDSAQTYEVPDEMFYVEGYSHSWTYASNLQTSLIVTRGLAASNDREYIDQISNVVRGYPGAGVGASAGDSTVF